MKLEKKTSTEIRADYVYKENANKIWFSKESLLPKLKEVDLLLFSRNGENNKEVTDKAQSKLIKIIKELGE